MERGYQLELIIGTMFAGKSTELIRKMNRHEVAGRTVQLFKPAIDDRYSLEHVTSHDNLRRECTYVKNFEELAKQYDPNVDVLGIDEVQFLDYRILNLCQEHTNKGGIVIASGLHKDFRDEDFPFAGNSNYTMADLLNQADKIIQLNAICTHKEKDDSICGRNATRVQRFIDGKVADYDSPIVLVGGKQSYAPKCRKHFQFYDKQKK